MLGKLESDRDDDDDTNAPIYVFDDNANGRLTKEETVVDSGAVECDEEEARATFESGGDTRVKTWRNMDVCRTERDQEGRQGNNQVDDRIRCPKEVCMVGAVSRTLISVDRLQETCLSWTCGYGFRQANRTFKSVRIL